MGVEDCGAGTGPLQEAREGEGRGGRHLGSSGDLSALVDVHLEEGDVGEILGELLVDRLDLLTRATPAKAGSEGVDAQRVVHRAQHGALGVEALSAWCTEGRTSSR